MTPGFFQYISVVCRIVIDLQSTQKIKFKQMSDVYKLNS